MNTVCLLANQHTNINSIFRTNSNIMVAIIMTYQYIIHYKSPQRVNSVPEDKTYTTKQ